MRLFVELMLNEGKIQRHEWFNVDAIDTFGTIDDGRTVIRLRSGSSRYVTESVPDILRKMNELVGFAYESDSP